MDAYELANKMEQLAGHFHNEAINMLRQQADRIAELEKLVHQRFDDGKRLGVIETEDRLKQQSAEPFIWLKQDFDGEWIEVHPNKGIPLYTTPQIKELSDEEINAVYHEVWNSNKWSDVEGIDIEKFARAILKKANEK
jgi:hypothetical protein